MKTVERGASLLLAYARVGLVVQNVMKVLLEKFRLSPRELEVMKMLLIADDWENVAPIARSLDLPKQRLSELLESLQMRRFVERRWSDGRSVQVRLTKDGVWRVSEALFYLDCLERQLLGEARVALHVVERFERRIDDFKRNVNEPPGGWYPFRRGAHFLD